MLGLKILSKPVILANPGPRPCIIPQIHPLHLQLRNRPLNSKSLVVYAKEPKSGDDAELNKEPKVDNGDDEKNQQPVFFNLKWTDLLLNPDPDNILAVGLTGLLTWASVQVVWQLLAVSFAIVVAALKYSFVAALLIFILVALL